MNYQKGYLFHNRYKLISLLGEGASAQVWKAKDTKANDLLVALKIFSQNKELDSYGLQNFEKEFTTVYNMRHSNLLPPTGYDIFQGQPYLVMQYCENGSCNSMVGRMEEDDVIKLMHDVAAGLEYLHDHNIIHQDIKPDNILLDDNCNFMVTDFGISVVSDRSVADSAGTSGGTRAYMGPERFRGHTVAASDIWSLGATVVEMLTGNPPFGEHGGLLQAQGESLPEIESKLQPEVMSMIKACLEADPTKRIKANEIRQKIELYWETGSWVKHSQKKTIVIVATAVISLLMCLGIFIWDYNRIRVYYYKDYAERWGVPEGIGRLSSNEVRHKEMCYRFEYRQRKLRHVSLVNSAGKVVSHTDTEHMASRYSDVYYYYTDNGKIDYTAIFDPYGRMLFKMDYDENLKTVTFRQNDDYGTEMNLDANTNVLYKGNASAFDEKSRISRYLLTYDEDGRLVERRYVGLQNVPAGDKDNIYGQRYKYDSEGRKTEEEFIGADGNTTCNGNGLAIKVYTYDENDDWTSVTYLNAERNGSHDGNNCSVVRLEYDDYGNRVKESYYSMDGSPAIRTDINVAGLKYVYNEKGFQVGTSYFGVDGTMAYSNEGIVSVRDSFNADGFIVHRDMLDENGEPALYNKNGECYSSLSIVCNTKGQILDLSYYDENGNPMEQQEGHYRWVAIYDSIGNNTSVKFFAKGDKPVLINGFYHEKRKEYDKFCRNTREYYLDDKGNMTTEDGTVADYRIEYHISGALKKISYFDTKGNPVVCGNLFAGFTIVYDEMGNQKSWQYFDTEGKSCMSAYGYSMTEYIYDPKTNFCIGEKKYDTSGRLIEDVHRKYDAKGNVIENYTLVDGKLKRGTAVEKKEYDVNNRITRMWCCDLSGRNVNIPQEKYSQAKYKYDKYGNCAVTTYWDADGKPAVDNQSSHRRVREFDAMNRVVCEKNFGTDGKPLSGVDVNPEGRVKYDQWGNMAEVSCYDGYGKPRLSSDGFFMSKSTYDRRGNVLHQEYLDTEGRLVRSKNNGYAKADQKYDTHGNRTEVRLFDEKSKCIRIETYKYNANNRMTEQRICDGNGQLSDRFYGVSRLTVDYDKNGIIPIVKKYYSQTGTLLATQTWNEKKGDWDDLKMTGRATAVMPSVESGSWMKEVAAAAQDCPYRIEDGLYIHSVSYTGSSVVVRLQLTEVSKYDLDDNRREEFETLVTTFRSNLRKAFGLPSNVSLQVMVLDKAERTI